MRRPCEDPAIPCRAPCKNPAAPQEEEEEEAPRRRGLPVTPRKPSRRRRGPLPQQEAKAQAPSRWLASKKRANCIWRSSINQEPLRSGRPSLRTPLSPPCFKILFTSGTETHMFFSIRIAARAKTLRGHVHEVAVQPSPPRKAVADSVPQRAPPLVVIVVVSVGAVAVVVDPPPSSPPTL